MTDLNPGNSVLEPRLVFVDSEIRVLEGPAALERLRERNDLQYLTQQGILQVDPARWQEAQCYERKTWMSNLVNAEDDRNHDHENNFAGYQTIAGRKFPRVLELGCGPFTNLRLILPHICAGHITLLDPLIKDYLQHPHCTYRDGSLLGVPVETVASSIEEFNPTEPYDLVVMANVLEHCFDVPAIFQRILQCLKPGGVFVFADNAFRPEQLEVLVANQFDAGHPIRVTEPLITEFLKAGFSELYHQRFYGGYDQPHRIDIYFIGMKKPQAIQDAPSMDLPAVDSATAKTSTANRRRIHFVYGGDPRNDAAVRAPATITNRIFRFLEQRAEVVYYDSTDTNTVPDVRPGDIVLGHPHPLPGTIMRRLLQADCAGKHLIFPFHSGLPEINRFAKEMAAVAQKLFLISGPYWTDNIGQTEYAAWQGKIVRLDNSLDLDFFDLRKKSFNPEGRRGMLVLGRSGPEKGTTELFGQLLLVPGKLMVAGEFSESDLAILQERPDTELLGVLDWRNEPLVQRVVAACDFFINFSVSDASPTTLFETMALGLIPITTPQCGYTYPSLIPLSLTDTENNLITLRNLQTLPQEELLVLQARNRALVEQNHNWPRFLATLWEGLTGEDNVLSAAGQSALDTQPAVSLVKANVPCGVKVAADYADKLDLTQIDGQSEFAAAIRRLFSEHHPKRIVETGTYFGEGTTRVIAETLRQLGITDAEFHSIEINPDHLARARQNLSRDGLAALVQLHHGVSVPRSLLPTMEEIERRTVRDIEENDIFVDHREHERAALYFKETDFHGVADDLLGQVLRGFGGRPDFVLLDSGGHMGNIEFNYLIGLLASPCWIALDDVHHIKHRRSLRQMQQDSRFQIIANSTEKFGFCLARFTPAIIEPDHGVQRLLWVRTDSIGDAVLASSTLGLLRQKYPNAKLAVLCQQHVAELFTACPFVDSIICYDRQKMDDTTERAQIHLEISAFNPDVILNSVRSRDHFSNELTQLFRAARHIAIEGDLNNISPADHARSLSGYELIVPTPQAHRTELDRHVDFLRGLGIEARNLRPAVWTTPADELLAEEFFKQQGLNPAKTIGVFPGAQHAVRIYPGYFEALNNFGGYRFLIFGDAAQSKLAEKLEAQMPGRTVNLCGRTSLRETAALLRRCRLYVGAESAGAHIACAVGVPNVVLLGGGHFGRFMPYSHLSSVVALPLACFGCDWRCHFKLAHCVQDVAPGSLAEAIRQTLLKTSDRPRVFLQPADFSATQKGLPQWQRPDSWLAGIDAEIIELTPELTATTQVPASLPSVVPIHQRVACPACGSFLADKVRQRADIVCCSDCELVYLRTRLTKDAMRKLYQSYADDGSHMALPKSRAEAAQSGLGREYFQQEILKFIEPGGGFLDVGCGWGGFLLNARAKGFTPRGIELTRKCVDYANRELEIPVTDVQLEEADIAPDSLSVVTMNHVLEHLPELRQALQKVHASLKSGGMFCGMVPNFASTCSDVLGEEWYWLDPNYHYTHFTPKTLRRTLESAGFIVEKIYTVTGDYGPETVRKANLARDAKLVDDGYFVTELKRYETEGHGEEIRFFARKPATADPVKTADQAEAEILLIPELPAGPEPVVSVVISTYQSEKFIRACLENVSRQKNFDRCEIIVVDSGSPENERAVVEEFQKKFPNIRYLRTPRETLYAAWNRGLTLARGRYWANLNTDDSLRDDALEILAAALDKHTDCALAYADCAWTTKPNDTFPSTNIVKTVKYPDYAPIETLFYCITGCLQFFRTESLRQLGGFDATLRCAGDYEATLKMMAARMNAVHVPAVLSLFYQNTDGLTQASNRAALEHDQVMNRYRGGLDFANIFKMETSDRTSTSLAATALASRCEGFFIPWENKIAEHLDFALACYHMALDLNPENDLAATGLCALHKRLHRLTQVQAELLNRWPHLKSAIERVLSGEMRVRPNAQHARLGPVYRPAEYANRPTTEQLAREPMALRPWITLIEGRHVQLSEELFPRPAGLHYLPEELQFAARRLAGLLAEVPPFYAHLGGAGDALLLLASFYDRKPDAVVFSHPNSVGAAQALFAAFPELSKIYFLPQHTEPFFHMALRHTVLTLSNCLGAGTTPKDNYEEEWKATLDIEKKYRISKSPRWAAALRQNENSRRVAVAPKGSLTGMVGSKRNIILPELWPQVLAHILDRGFEPVIFGVPSEAKDYPALPGCTDARGESFPGQMKSIGQCAGLVGADSWAKTFSALAEIPTLVFEPLKSADLVTWKDPSDWVFIEPWPGITMIRSLEEFRPAFDARIAKISGAEPQDNSKPVIAWEGSFLDYGSLSHINRELTSRLATTFDLTCVGPKVLNGRTPADPAMQRCAKKLAAKASAETAVTVRHQWPPNWAKPASGALVVIQPWEYGALPKAWIANEKNVDEFWVPSPIVRAMYVDSGIAPEKVRVVPNGVDTKKFRPGLRPLGLKTKKKFKFLFVGGTIFRKGPDILFAAFSQAFTAADDVCLVVKDFGGDSCYQGQTAGEAIRALQQKPGAPEILHLTDELSAEQMPSLYAACDCFVLPYRGEGFGMPVLEAMACGLPVIVTGGGATDSFVSADAGWMIPSRGIRLSDHVGDIPLVKNGWMLEPSTSYLANILKLAASRPGECRQRGANGRARAEKRFDWSDIAASVTHRLKELAERAPFQAQSGKTGQPVGQSLKPFAKADPQVSPTKLVLPAVARAGQLEEARELFAEKNLSAAWKAALIAIAHRPFHPEAFLLLAEIARVAGNGQSAKLCAQRARAFAPGWNPAKQFLKNPLKGNVRLDWLQPSAILHPPSSPRLSVCLIVKNEEKFLAQCLQSVRGLASQIIVVDTGSTDRTVEIAKEFGAEIYAFKWNDDFAAARNAALEHATGDWVLMLDADEELPAAQHAQLRSDMNQSDVMAFRLPLVNRGQEAEGRSFVPRLIRNAPGNFYFGCIHEQIFSSLLPQCKAWGLKTALGTAAILHHGYTKEMLRDRNKIERNLKLLPRAIAENPTDVNLVMNLGLELVRSGDLARGVTKYRDAFELMSAQPSGEVVAELREVLLTQFTSQLYKIRAHEEVVQVLDSSLARKGGLTASLHFALGLAHFELKDYRAAANQMRQCLAKRKQSALSPINTDILTAAPNHCLALSLAKLDDLAGAEKAFEAALGESGRLDDVKLDHAKFLLNQNRAVDALNELHQIVTTSPVHLAAWRLGGEIALSQPDFLEFARDWTGEAVKNQPEDFTITAQRAEALMLSGDTAAAGELWERVWNRERQPQFLAALILCEAVESPTTHAPEDGPDELAASRAFIVWYQKLIASRAQTVIVRINEQAEKLSRALPTAAKILEAALAESETCDTV